VKKKILTEDDVVEHLRAAGSVLLLMHDGEAKAWFVPGLGRIDDDVAHAVLAREDVYGTRDPQWPGIPQVFKYRRVA